MKRQLTTPNVAAIHIDAFPHCPLPRQRESVIVRALVNRQHDHSRAGILGEWSRPLEGRMLLADKHIGSECLHALSVTAGNTAKCRKARESSDLNLFVLARILAPRASNALPVSELYQGHSGALGVLELDTGFGLVSRQGECEEGKVDIDGFLMERHWLFGGLLPQSIRMLCKLILEFSLWLLLHVSVFDDFIVLLIGRIVIVPLIGRLVKCHVAHGNDA